MFYRIISLCILFLFAACQAQTPPDKKFNGISLVASRDTLNGGDITPIIEINANAVAVMPFAFMRDLDHPELIYNRERQWFGERVLGIEHTIDLLHARDLEVMLKPQIWIGYGKFTGDMHLTTEAHWQELEKAYRDYIMLYAEIAEKKQVPLFCIGTELFGFVKERPKFWKKLIAELRKNYSGELVYAENWDKVAHTDIWENLDYIGVDAYFPISSESSPTEEEIKEGWQKHKSLLYGLSRKYKKPVLFTEYGYRNIDYALKEPWTSDRDNSSLNHNLQAKALEVIIDEFWTENWFAGGFLWKWHHQKDAGGLENNRFTPQNKPAEKVIREKYLEFKN